MFLSLFRLLILLNSYRFREANYLTSPLGPLQTWFFPQPDYIGTLKIIFYNPVFFQAFREPFRLLI